MEEEQTKKIKIKWYVILIIIIVVIILALLLIFGLPYLLKGTIEPDPIENPDIVLEPTDYTLNGEGINDFDLSFITLENTEENLVYSPLSIKYALSMLEDASSGSTKEEISTVIGNYNPSKYTNSENLSIANGIFINNDYKSFVNTTFTNNIKTKYNASIIYDDFNDASKVNNWVSENTFNLIKSIINDQEAQNTKFAFANTVAIDMMWVNSIQESDFNTKFINEDFSNYIDENNRSGVFNNEENMTVSYFGASTNRYDIVNVLGRETIKNEITTEYNDWKMTTKDGFKEDTTEFVNEYIDDLDSNYKKVFTSTDFYYYVTDDEKVFAKDLQTYNDTTLEYVAIMPTNTSLKEYLSTIKSEDINSLISNLKYAGDIESYTDGKVTKLTGMMPMFKYEYNLNLKKDLIGLGISTVFTPGSADLSNFISQKDAYISKALHKATIDFSNDGIKAAAVTYFGYENTAILERDKFSYLYEVPIEEIDLTFDKPFLYIIRDKNTGEVFFTGTTYTGYELKTK